MMHLCERVFSSVGYVVDKTTIISFSIDYEHSILPKRLDEKHSLIVSYCSCDSC